MLMITFQTQSSRWCSSKSKAVSLKGVFEQTERFQSMDDWRLFNLALFHGQAKIVRIVEEA